MKAAVATFGGIYLTNSRPVEWALRVGTQPYQTIFEFHKDEADQVDAMIGKPHDLVMTASNGDTARFSNVYVTGAAPASAPWLRAFYASDSRWLWARRWVYRHKNVVRRTGDKYLLAGVPTAISAPLDSFTYADWSLEAKDRRWTSAKDVDDVLKAVAGRYRIEGQIPDVPIQGAETDDPGDVAIDRALAPTGFNVIVDYDGTAVAFDARALSDAEALLRSAPPAIEGSAFPAKSVLRGMRPSEFVVLFNREVELRFDSLEEDNATVNEDARFMRNVVPVPDDSLTVTFDGKTRAVGRGTYVPLDAVLAAWNADRPSGAPPLTVALIRKLWLHGNALEATYCDLGKRAPPLPNWVMRIATLRKHFRRTYQISNKWMRRIKGLRAHRVGIYDPLNGVHAPAGVFMDYAVMCSDKGLSQAASEQFLWLNVHGYPGVGTSPDGAGSLQGPAAFVTILDQDVGVIHVDFALDTLGLYARAEPSLVVDERGREQGLTANMAAWKDTPIVTGAKVRGTQTFVELSSSHRICVVLSAIPAAPNSEVQFHDIHVAPGKFAKHFAGIAGASGGTGPALQTRVGANVVNARVMWVEDQAALYARIFGLDASQRGISAAQIPAALVANAKDLEEEAVAVAARLWAEMIDRYEGARTVHFDSSALVRPKGNIDVVTHVLGTDGVLRTTISASPHLRATDPLAYLPDSVRTGIFRILPPGGA